MAWQEHNRNIFLLPIDFGSSIRSCGIPCPMNGHRRDMAGRLVHTHPTSPTWRPFHVHARALEFPVAGRPTPHRPSTRRTSIASSSLYGRDDGAAPERAACFPRTRPMAPRGRQDEGTSWSGHQSPAGDTHMGGTSSAPFGRRAEVVSSTDASKIAVAVRRRLFSTGDPPLALIERRKEQERRA